MMKSENRKLSEKNAELQKQARELNQKLQAAQQGNGRTQEQLQSVESMSDGYNDVFDEPSMGWARYAHTMRIWVYKSGFFYIRPTIPSIELLDRVATQPNSGTRQFSMKSWLF
ncbi:hypothetical protein RDI58_009776 [Solanum bulbocastanum]|uniref:Uncharacterized protein n=1 Tax=Solanum bulbocastanum TaxID=147425 RepID=A0AAN8TP65_SOLBU